MASELRNRFLLLCAVLLFSAPGATANDGAKFFPDDPILVDPETMDASGVQSRSLSEGYDYIANTLLLRGDGTAGRAWNVNTIDEVPDSSWFVDRILTSGLTPEEIRRGPDTGGPRAGSFRVLASKTEGITPGFTMRDSSGQLYFVKADPKDHHEMASAAEVITTKALWAIGYNVPENYIASFRREDLILEGATFTDTAGRKRPMNEKDLDEVLSKMAAGDDGTYRVMASKALPGKPLGPFRFYGTRADDPNDIFAHEHRRELRGLRVFAAWLNHSDSRANNTLDMLVDVEGRAVVRHNLLDFGSTLGSGGIGVKSRRSGNTYIWDIRESVLQALTLGVRVPDWARTSFPDVPSVGRFESEFFQPERWTPHIRNPAYENARPDDLFWGARRVMAFTEDRIEALVAEGQLSDPRAEALLVRTLMERRDKIGRAWLTCVNPLVDFRLASTGELTFANAAVDHGFASAPAGYQLSWYRFDNLSRESFPAGSPVSSSHPAASAPSLLLSSALVEFIKVEIRTMHPQFPVWEQPVHVTFRRAGASWKTVGIERIPEVESSEPETSEEFLR